MDCVARLSPLFKKWRAVKSCHAEIFNLAICPHRGRGLLEGLAAQSKTVGDVVFTLSGAVS